MNAIVQVMNDTVSSPNVLPIFKSEVQFRILGELFTHPDLEVALGELAQRIDRPRPTVSHEIARLVKAGLVIRRSDGNKALLRAALHTPVSEDLRSLLSKTYGPLAALRDAFSELPVSHVAVFGSFAARWRGEPGPPPNDIDVLVVGDVDYETLWDLTAKLSRKLGIDVNAVLRRADAWETDDSAFANAVKRGHVVDVIGQRPGAKYTR